MRPRRLAALALCVALAAAAAACGGSDGGSDGAAAIVESTASTSPYIGMVRDPAPDVGALALPDAATGEPFAFRPAAGRVLLVYFGFTSCPDVCPTTLADLRSAVRDLPAADRGRVDVAMVTVDPDRDSAKALTAYLRSFFPSGTALRTADEAALKRVTDGFSAAYEIRHAADGSVKVIHSGFVYAVGPEGRLIVQWPFGLPKADVTRDLERALATIDGGASS